MRANLRATYGMLVEQIGVNLLSGGKGRKALAILLIF